MFDNLSASISNCITVAKRCALLNCAPMGVARLLTLFERQCGSPKNVYYWPEKERKGVLLIEAHSTEALHQGLCRIPGFVRLSVNHHHGSEPIELPPFRLCSDPSRWPLPPNRFRATEREVFDGLNLSLQSGMASSKTLHAKLMHCSSLAEQATVLHETMQLTYPEMLARFVVSDSLQEILSFLRPGTEVSVFGSAVDGLGSSSSDLDLVINMSTNISPSLSHIVPLNAPRRVTRLNADFPLIPALLAPNSKLRSSFLFLLRRLLMRLDPLGFHGTRIFPGRIPILHVPRFNLLGVGLDVSRVFEGLPETGRTVNFHDGRTMASLMRMLALCVPQFRQCISVLKFISRRGELTRQGPSPGFTNFKLTVLFIHFLQAHGYAPSFDRLTALRDSLLTHSSPDPLLLEGLCPVPSIDVLLEQFLTYIPTINPSHFLMSLSAGRLISRTAAEPLLESCLRFNTDSDSDDLASFGDSFSDQDYLICPNPIHPCHNMLRGIDEADWALLACTCEQWLKDLRTHSQGPSPWGLLALRKFPSTSKSESKTSPLVVDSSESCDLHSSISHRGYRY